MKVKTIIIAIALVVVFIGATLLYNALSDKAGPGDLVMTPPQQTKQPETSPSQQPEQPGSSPPQQTEQPETPPTGGESTGNTATTEQPDSKLEAPDFTVQDAEGNDVKLSDMRGRPVVLNFWASWCPPCKGEMPDFNKVYGELGEDIQFMMVCIVDGSRETVKTGASFISDSGYSFPVFFDVTQEAGTVYAVRSIPTTYFIDAEGYLITGAEGAINEETLLLGISYISALG